MLNPKIPLFKKFSRAKQKAGLSPGTLVHTGAKKREDVVISLIDYSEKELEETILKSVEEAFPFKDTSTVTWINIDGLHEVSVIESLGKHFGLHPLVMEDILSTEQRPKVEEHSGYLYLVLRMFYYKEGQLSSEQVSLILGKNFVLSFQEETGDVFNPVRDRLRKSKGRIRRMKADYLTYALLDAVVDNYFIVLEELGEKLEALEEELTAEPTQETLKTIHHMKREALYLRKSVWPLREVISNLQRGGNPLVMKDTLIFLKDVYDHTIQVIDTIENSRDILAGMLDIYLSTVSNKMNEVMKVLTIIATIFIPLTFIAGVYGMNFRHMPELEWRYGYFSVLGLMVLIFIGMLFYFRKKEWL